MAMETILFDKTGTLTEAELRFERLVPADGETIINETEVCRYAYAALIHSPHIAAKAFCETIQVESVPQMVSEIENIPGRGICAQVDGKLICCGNARMLNERGVQIDPTEKTAIYLAMDGCYLGRLEFSSRVKAGVNEALTQLRESGVKRMAILSGDASATVDEVGNAIGIEERYAGLLPAEKLTKFEEIYRDQKQKSDKTVAFCGDGLNDSAVIAASDVGIAMGRGGSAVTVESADIILMDDAPEKIPVAKRLAGRIVRIANQNIAISLGLKIGIALICVIWVPSMELALIADVGSAVITVLNAMRAGRKYKG